MEAYDGEKKYELAPGEAVIARKNHLIRYSKQNAEQHFQSIVIALDELFLKQFVKRYFGAVESNWSKDSFLRVSSSALLDGFLNSVGLYYLGPGKLEPNFADVKREELLLILFNSQPELAGILLNFASPEKIPLDEFMNRNFRFNLSLERFAFLSGRSLSAFKRDFCDTFNQPPGKWLTSRRLEEAYFQIHKAGRNPVSIYLELGFENLSHFSKAFRRQYGFPPTELLKQTLAGQSHSLV
jgi:AraC-like DNA-binding protein